jgi:hypothetical protein
MAGGIIAGIGPGGQPVPIQATAGGQLEVDAATGGATGGSTEDLLAVLIWEMRELRRVYCEATDQLFTEYPA